MFEDFTKHEQKYDSKHEQKYDSKYEQKYDSKYDSKHEPKYDSNYDSNYDSKYDSKHDSKYEPKYDSKYEDKSYYNDNNKDADGLDNTDDWEIRKNFDYYRSIRRIAEDFFSYDDKKAWDNIKRINGLKKYRKNKKHPSEGMYGLKDAVDYNDVEDELLTPADKLMQTTINVLHDNKEKNIAAKKVLGNEDLNKKILQYFGGIKRSKKYKKKNRKSKKKMNTKNH